MATKADDDRLREVEVNLAAHLATCSEATKNANHRREQIQTDIRVVRKMVESLRKDRDKVTGGVLVFKVAAAAIAVGSIILNIYWALNR